MTAYDWITLVVIVFCIFLSAFFAGSETALTASSRASMHRLDKQGNRRAVLVNHLLNARERMIGALLFGNNAVNIAASALATGLLLDWFGEWRTIEVVANDGQFPLLGVGLFRGRELHISYARGTITLD